MNCPHCRRTLYTRRPRCEHCGEALPEECLVPPPWEEALKAEIREVKNRIARTRAEAAKEEERQAWPAPSLLPPDLPPPDLPPPGF